MGFAGKVWRLLVGIKDALALLFLLLFFLALFAVLSARPNPGLVRDGALLLQLDGVVVEEASPIDPIATLLAQSLPTREFAARELVHAIDEAAGDDRIEAIALDMSLFLGGGQVHLQEIGEALDRFRRADKNVYAYAVAYTDDSLLLAAHADEVWVDPMGGAAIAGPGGKRMYYGAALDRFNITPNVFRVGTFKSAVEPYLGNAMSPEARENAQTIYSSVWDEWQAHVRSARPKADIAAVAADPVALIEAAGGDVAQAALRAGLADRIGTREEWGDHIASVVGEDEWDKTPGTFASTALDPYLAEIAPDGFRLMGSGEGKIGVVTIAGTISDGEAGPGEAGAQRIAGILDDALDDDLDALVLRIDSPGGTVTGSEVIRRAILRHKAKGIPIVASFGNYAASGGYWVATPADTIVAEPETLTGSIGVFIAFPSFEGLLSDYGITGDGVQTTPLSGQPDLLFGLSDEAGAMIQAETDAVYARFLGLVAQSRNIDRARADELGQGRVWTGGAARQLGLVDQLGGLDSALEIAAKSAQLGEGEWRTVFLGAQEQSYAPLIAQLLGGGQSAQSAALPTISTVLTRREKSLVRQVAADLDQLMQAEGIQARCLECASPHPHPVRGESRDSSWLVGLLVRAAGAR